jgi:two-component system OmpR family response regulator
MSDLVLIVDDDEKIYSNTEAFLEDEGYRVIIATSGEQGLLLLQQHRPKFAIVDMRLPGMDGNHFIQRASRQQSQLQFLIHTGSIEYKLPEVLRENSQVCQSVFYKPLFSMEVLVKEMCG